MKDQYSDLIEQSKSLYKNELKRHNDAGHPLNMLLFLVDNGITKADGLTGVYDQMMNNTIDNAFSVVLNINERYGGSGQPLNSWISCDLPLTTYISIKLNHNKIEAAHKKAIEKVTGLMEDDKWKCKSCDNLGNFRGPGKKNDECPITTLNVLKLLTLTPSDEFVYEKEAAVKILLNLWNDRKIRKPFLFGMGTDFLKLKYPLIWYDILNLMSVLSQFPEALKTKEYKQLFTELKKNTDENGFIPQSVYRFWKNFDFGQKKTTSTYIEKVYREIESRSLPFI